MTQPPLASARISHTSDIDAQSALLVGWNQNYRQLSGGLFSGALSEVDLPRAYLFREITSHALLQIGELDRETVAVGLPLQIRGPATFCGGRCGGTKLHLFSGRNGFEFHTPEGLDIAVAVLPRALLGRGLDDSAAARLDARLCEAQLLATGDASFRGLREMLENLLPCTARQPCDARKPCDTRQSCPTPGQLSAMTADLAQKLRDCLLEEDMPGEDPLRADTTARRMAIISGVRAAIEQAAPEDVLNVELMCRQIGVSRRSLQYAFELELGLRPIAYMRALRLNRARGLIRSGQNVTEAATEAGFWHFGRFSQEYRALFGERPSQTRRLHS